MGPTNRGQSNQDSFAVPNVMVKLAAWAACLLAAGRGVADAAATATAACSTAMDCHLNGDCHAGSCVCDAAWSGSADCAVMSFEALDKDAMPGYYNATQSSWGGFPVEDPTDGGYVLFHAQMANGCGLGTWTSNSVVARSRSTTGRVEGPYAFEAEVLPHFAHNPTIRRAADGTYVVYFIGGWPSEATKCAPASRSAAVPLSSSSSSPSSSSSSTSFSVSDGVGNAAKDAGRVADDPAACVANTTFDDPSQVREGKDYATTTLSLNATISDCAASCCGDAKCRAFSFNTFANASTPPICKHKSAGSVLVTNTCPFVRGQHNCLSGARTDAPPAPAPTCDGRHWPKTCGTDMPGPSHDCCGPVNATYNANTGCGIAMATASSLAGPWTVQPLVITDQFDSDEVYCAHTNPTAVFDPDTGGVTLAFNAGFCNGELETIGVASAPHWSGPYTLLNKQAVLRNADGSPHRCEDPHLWRSQRGWHLLVHNQQGPQAEAAYAYSADAANWTLSPTTPYDCTLHYTDGSTAEATGCGNRPQLVFSQTAAAGGAPQWLVNGAQAAHPGGGKGTWTLFRKVARTAQ